jgi:hypothetical protein
VASTIALSIAEAAKRNDWHQQAVQVDAALRRGPVDAYAGIWVDEEHGGRVKIGMAGQAPLPAQASRDIAAVRAATGRGSCPRDVQLEGPAGAVVTTVRTAESEPRRGRSADPVLRASTTPPSTSA